jgi:hypothetical protein
MAKKSIATTGKNSVKIQKKESGQVVSDKEVTESLETIVTPEPPATVQFKLGETINTGNFCSTRIDVGVFIPCELSKLNETFENASVWVRERLQEELKKSSDSSSSRPKTLNESTEAPAAGHPF